MYLHVHLLSVSMALLIFLDDLIPASPSFLAIVRTWPGQVGGWQGFIREYFTS
jgi:hypothetical protein